jgi:DEAD/DEAH box helicase domain-containing protein
VLSTGTASGKSLCYQIPIIDRLIKQEPASALLMYPTKALTYDQLNGLRQLIPDSFRSTVIPAVYDGDTPQRERKAIRDNAKIILTNPDMLNIGILPNHAIWASFFENLRFVVIDEIHIYRGVFGSHVANVLRRLRRITQFYGSNPVYVMTSATIQNPRELGENLVGLPVECVHEDGSPKGERNFVIYNPPLINEELGIREGLMVTAEKFLAQLIQKRVQTLVFCRTRRFVEILLRETRSFLNASSSIIRGYRSGYLKTERREIEQGLKSGEIVAAIATNALELGVDIGGVDAVLLPGFPGTVAAMIQRAGRAGRKFNPSLAVFIASMNPLDQYLARNPQYLISRNPEKALINPDNPLILLEHLQCAAAELPISRAEKFGSLDAGLFNEYLDYLADNNILHQKNDRYYWVSDDYPSQHVSLRSSTSTSILLQSEVDRERTIIGEVDYNSGLWMVHPGAIYIHSGETFRVENLDLEKNIATLVPSNDDYITEPVSSVEVEVVEETHSQDFAYYWLKQGEILVRSAVKGYKRIKWQTREVIDYSELALPETTLRTVGYWMVLKNECVEKMRDSGLWMSDKNDYGPDWQRIRKAVRQRDGYCCQVCGIKEGQLEHHVHHKIPFKRFDSPEKANALENLITLCQNCHRMVESQIRVRSAISGLKYVLENLSPLLVMCDSGDLGSVVDPAAKFAANQPAILFYDAIPAGIGLAEELYKQNNALLLDARDLVKGCNCSDGCPSCVGPTLDTSAGGKQETLYLIDLLLNQ